MFTSMSKEEASKRNLPTFNAGTHALVELEEKQTLILQLPNGVRVTVALVGGTESWGCLEIQAHNVYNHKMLGFTKDGTQDEMVHGLYSLDINKDKANPENTE